MSFYKQLNNRKTFFFLFSRFFSLSIFITTQIVFDLICFVANFAYTTIINHLRIGHSQRNKIKPNKPKIGIFFQVQNRVNHGM